MYYFGASFSLSFWEGFFGLPFRENKPETFLSAAAIFALSFASAMYFSTISSIFFLIYS
jgi:hypothetical protein